MAFFKYFLFVLQPDMLNYEIREFANSTIQRTKQAIYEIPILIITRETIFLWMCVLFLSTEICKKISIILYTCIPFFHHVHCGVYFFISFFSVSPSDSIRHECITPWRCDSPFHMPSVIWCTQFERISICHICKGKI